MTRTDGVARQLYEQLPPAKQLEVQRWRRKGHGWTTALLNSGVLSSRRAWTTPEQADRDAARAAHERALADWELSLTGLGARRETAEHEAAHVVVAEHLGLAVVQAHIDPTDDRGGGCLYTRGEPRQTAMVAMAGEMWIGLFRSLQFIGPPRGCEYDHRIAAEALGNDRPSHMRAWDDCRLILKANKDAVLAIADQLERDGQVTLL